MNYCREDEIPCILDDFARDSENAGGNSVSTLLIDCYDSYTYNLFQLLTVINGVEPIVVYNDDFDGDWRNVEAAFPNIHNIVISPGPGRPEKCDDFGICADCLKNAKVPVLGVCLGHQGLCHVYGGKVINAPQPIHGRWSSITFSEDCDLFRKISQKTKVVRYHSLIADSNNFPSCLRAVCWTDDQQSLIMGVQHRNFPLYGVQFHPESIGTHGGPQFLINFKRITLDWWKTTSTRPIVNCRPYPAPQPLSKTADSINVVNRCKWSINIALIKAVSFVSSEIDSDMIFQSLYSEERVAFWMDSSSAAQAKHIKYEGAAPSRFSFMGDARGPLNEVLEYWSDGIIREVHFHSFDNDQCPPCYRYLKGDIFDVLREKFQMLNSSVVNTEWQSIWNNSNPVNLQNSSTPTFNLFEIPVNLADEQLETAEPILLQSQSTTPKLPFDFFGGYVGAFGYEVRHTTSERLAKLRGAGQRTRQNSASNVSSMSPLNVGPRQGGAVPDALWMFADRIIIIDHEKQQVYLLWVSPDHGDSGMQVVVNPELSKTCLGLFDACCTKTATYQQIKQLEKFQLSWVQKATAVVAKHIFDRGSQSPLICDGCESSMDQSDTTPSTTASLPCTLSSESTDSVRFICDRSRDVYEKNILDILEYIRQGETYEVCLTNHLVAEDVSVDPVQLFRIIRKTNPAPFSVFIRYDIYDLIKESQSSNGEAFGSSFAICCSSPERFLKLDRLGNLESKPIKGTCTRGLTEEEDLEFAERLRTSVKERAENLMITDLIRNDFGRVCIPGTVTVPKLLDVETYANVHQLVSTVHGVLRQPQYDMFDAIIACFPGGSMTGAPKRRTLEIIDRLEESIPRGIYSGSIGFLSIDGAFDMNIVIRTVLVTPSKLSVGAGGAIIALSNVNEEYEEMLLKANSVLRGCREYFAGQKRQLCIDTKSRKYDRHFETA